MPTRIASEDLVQSQHSSEKLQTHCMQWFNFYALRCKGFGPGLALQTCRVLFANVSIDMCKLFAMCICFQNVQICLVKLFPKYLRIEISTQLQKTLRTILKSSWQQKESSKSLAEKYRVKNKKFSSYYQHDHLESASLL